MNDDEILILLFLMQNKDVTTTDIAKALFINNINSKELNREQKNKKEIELRNNDRRVRYYLNKFVRDNLVSVNIINTKQKFNIIKENVHIGIAKINMTTFDSDDVSIGLGKILMCKTKDGIIIEPIPKLEIIGN